MDKLKQEIQVAINIYKTGNLSKAEEACQKLIKKNPNIAFLYNLLGLILTAQDKPQEALFIYNKGLKIDPDYALIYNNIGLIYFKNKSEVNIKKSEDFYKKAIALDVNAVEPQTNLGNLYSLINKNEDSIKCHKNAININPNLSYPYLNLANVYVSIGKFKDAEKYLKKAIKINPDFFYAHRLLSRITKYNVGNNHLKQLILLYKGIRNKDTENKMFIAFSLGKAFEDIGNFNKSFSFYKEANLLFRKTIHFSIKEEKKFFTKIKTISNKKAFENNNMGCSNSSPIFIVGMPRSGTTLVEQILSSHPNVFGGDELEFIPNLFKKNIDKDFNFKNKDFKKIGEEYIYEMSKISNLLKITTDKLPANFLYIGFIKLILPNSKIIHCHRNSKDNIFSIYKNHFPGKKISFAYDLGEIVNYYNLYNSLMKHWNNIFPNFIYNIKYETLISKTENEVKNLLNFCNLSWHDDCLKFYKNKRPIKTASDIQVRNKIYSSSINKWKNYKKYLNKYFLKLKL